MEISLMDVLARLLFAVLGVLLVEKLLNVIHIKQETKDLFYLIFVVIAVLFVVFGGLVFRM